METYRNMTPSEELWSCLTQLKRAEAKAIALRTEWLDTARDKQLQPKYVDHYIWLILAGRGWGKTRTGAQDIALYALRNPNSSCAVVAPTHGDLRRVCFGGRWKPRRCLEKKRGEEPLESSTVDDV